jgi:carbonic anhydrase/acetyltransferase-like protein (isoleucine patch superfamily)
MEQEVVFISQGVSMQTTQKVTSLIVLLAIMLSFATPAYAFDGRTGEDIVIKQGEVIEDDLYIGARSFTLDGTVKGDLIVGAETVIINGTVEGDLIVGAQTVVINGTVTEAARVFVAAAQVGSEAEIGGDLLAMGGSVEVKQGSTLGSDLVTGSGQTLLAGSVAGDVLAGTSALEIRGPVEGDVRAYVDISEDTASAQPINMYLSNSPISIPSVKPGLTLGEDAQIGGNLDYTSSIELAIPAGVVAGKVNRFEPSAEVERAMATRTPTAGERVLDWFWGLLRSMITLILFGLLVSWLFPKFMRLLPDTLRAEPLTSLGWGAILFAAVFFTLMVIVLVTIMLALVGLRWNIFWLAWLLLTVLGTGFLLATSYLAKVVVGDAVGKWILARFNSPLAEHKLWPMVVGVVAVVLVIGLLRFPLVPFIGFFGWLLNFVVVLFGLGALWIWGRALWASRRAEVVPA